MKKTKKTATKKTKAKKPVVKKVKKTMAKKTMKAAIKTKVKAKSKKKTTSEQLLIDHIIEHESRRNVIPEGMGRTSWDASTGRSQTKKRLLRKVAGKKPVYPLADSE